MEEEKSSQPLSQTSSDQSDSNEESSAEQVKKDDLMEVD